MDKGAWAHLVVKDAQFAVRVTPGASSDRIMEEAGGDPDLCDGGARRGPRDARSTGVAGACLGCGKEPVGLAARRGGA